MKYMSLALSLLTAFPVRVKGEVFPGDSGRAAGWYPLIGLLIGFATALMYTVAQPLFPPGIAAFLAALVWILLTGGLHLDGLADCCDGMLHASTPERRLTIMKDSRLGSFGGIGLMIAILGKILFLFYLPQQFTWYAIPLAAATGRWMLLPAGKQPMARPTGMGADFSSGLTWKHFIPASITLAAILILSSWRGLFAFFAAGLVTLAMIRLARSRLGGLTGDVFGMIVEISELVVLLVFCIRI